MTFQQKRSRRDFLRVGGRALSTIGAAAAFGQAGLVTARAQSSGDYKALVCIFLFGGNDANNMLVPNDTATYANYQKIRQNLALPQGSLVPIHDAASNANYGLHPVSRPSRRSTTGRGAWRWWPTWTLVQRCRAVRTECRAQLRAAAGESLLAFRPAERVAERGPQGGTTRAGRAGWPTSWLAFPAPPCRPASASAATRCS